MKNLLTINPKQEVDRIINFLKRTLREQKINKVVLGFSGGIDSTVALYLLKKALPAENIYAVQMDYKPRKKLDIDLKGINIINISIKKIIDEFQKFLKDSATQFLSHESLSLPSFQSGGPLSKVKKLHLPHLSSSKTFDKIRLGNIMARVRMIILFDLAKQLGALVCGTENKSERLLGYFTRFGDAASDLEPISHLYKTQVYQLAKYLDIPKETINQLPSAGLWDGQTDENDFGFTYEEADQVLYLMYDRSQDINNLQKKFPNAEKIIKRMQKNQFKLRTPYHL